MSGKGRGARLAPLASSSAMYSSTLAPVTCRILAIDSVDGQRGRPAGGGRLGGVEEGPGGGGGAPPIASRRIMSRQAATDRAGLKRPSFEPLPRGNGS